MMKTQLTTNPERDLPKNLKKQKHPNTTMNEETQVEDREFEEPQRPVDTPLEKNLIRGNLLGYMKVSKVWKDMGLQKRITEKERGPDPTPGM